MAKYRKPPNFKNPFLNIYGMISSERRLELTVLKTTYLVEVNKSSMKIGYV